MQNSPKILIMCLVMWRCLVKVGAIRLIFSLQKSPPNALAIKAHHLLQSILTVHTPSQTSSLYHSVLGFYTDGDGMSDERGDSWEFMKTVYR